MKDKTTAGLLGIFLGSWGAHHFYLGNTNKALLYLLLSLFTGIGVIVFSIIGLIEGITYFCMSKQEFDNFMTGYENSENGTVLYQSNHSDDITMCLDRCNLVKKYKTLLDNETLTQEEFDAIKINILGR
jgi:TM2 domain-containing membrane protein YozV